MQIRNISRIKDKEITLFYPPAKSENNTDINVLTNTLIQQTEFPTDFDIGENFLVSSASTYFYFVCGKDNVWFQIALNQEIQDNVLLAFFAIIHNYATIPTTPEELLTNLKDCFENTTEVMPTPEEKICAINDKLEKTKRQLQANIEKIIGRNDQISTLVAKTEQLSIARPLTFFKTKAFTKKPSTLDKLVDLLPNSCLSPKL